MIFFLYLKYYMFGLFVMCIFRFLFCFEKKGEYKVVLLVNIVIEG